MDTYTTCNSINTLLGRWYCSLCDKNSTVRSKTGHINSNFHKRSE